MGPYFKNLIDPLFGDTLSAYNILNEWKNSSNLQKQSCTCH